jgi:hypothetical protein
LRRRQSTAPHREPLAAPKAESLGLVLDSASFVPLLRANRGPGAQSDQRWSAPRGRGLLFRRRSGPHGSGSARCPSARHFGNSAPKAC